MMRKPIDIRLLTGAGLQKHRVHSQARHLVIVGPYPARSHSTVTVVVAVVVVACFSQKSFNLVVAVVMFAPIIGFSSGLTSYNLSHVPARELPSPHA